MLRLFDHECTNCGNIFEAVIDAEVEYDLPCPRCRHKSERLPPIVNVNMGVGAYGYYDETLDKGISTNKQLREEMQRQGVTKKGDTPKDGGAWV